MGNGGDTIEAIEGGQVHLGRQRRLRWSSRQDNSCPATLGREREQRNRPGRRFLSDTHIKQEQKIMSCRTTQKTVRTDCARRAGLCGQARVLTRRAGVAAAFLFASRACTHPHPTVAVGWTKRKGDSRKPEGLPPMQKWPAVQMLAFSTLVQKVPGYNADQHNKLTPDQATF